MENHINWIKQKKQQQKQRYITEGFRQGVELVCYIVFICLRFDYVIIEMFNDDCNIT